MRKNKIVGAIKGAGRKKEKDTKTELLNVRISDEARQALNSLPRMERGKLVDQLIRDHFMI